MSTFFPPLVEIRHKAMCLSDDSAGGVFREEKAAGMEVVPMPVNAAVADGGDVKYPSPGVYEYKCPMCGGKAYNGDPETGTQFRGSGKCHDCGGGFALVAMNLKPVSDKPVKVFDPLSDSPAINREQPTADNPACVMLDLPAELSAMLVRLAETIDPDHRHEKGVERVSHITVKYGLTCGIASVSEAVKGFGPVEYQLGEFRVFHQEGKDVLYVDVLSPGLHKLNRTLSALPCREDDHPKYVPHVTLAYLKSPTRGARPADVYAAAWNGAIQLTAHGTADELTYSGPDKVPCCIPLVSPVPARVGVEQVREKGYDEQEGDDKGGDDDGAQTIWSAADHDRDHPAAQDVVAEALRMMGADGPEEGTPAHAASQFMVELARKWKANPEHGQEVLDRLRDEPEFREQILGHLNQSTREKGNSGEGESAPTPPVKPVKATKPKGQKQAKAGATTPAATPGVEPPAGEPAGATASPVAAEKPKGGRRRASPVEAPPAEAPPATPAEPPATPEAPPTAGEQTPGIHPDVMKHIVATHELLASMGSGPLTHEHLTQLTDHLRDTTHAHLDHYINAHGIPAKSGTKAVKAARVAQRMIGSRVPAVPYGLKELPPESGAPQQSGIDHLIGSTLDSHDHGKGWAGHISGKPKEADKVAAPAAPPSAERQADPEPPPAAGDHSAVQAVRDHLDTHAVHVHAQGEPPVRVTHVEDTPAGPVVHDEAGGKRTGEELHAQGAELKARPMDDATRDMPAQRLTPPDSTAPAHPVQKLPPGSPPVKIPSQEGMDDDGDGEGESDESRTFPNSRSPLTTQQQPPDPPADSPVPARTTPDDQQSAGGEPPAGDGMVPADDRPNPDLDAAFGVGGAGGNGGDAGGGDYMESRRQAVSDHLEKHGQLPEEYNDPKNVTRQSFDVAVKKFGNNPATHRRFVAAMKMVHAGGSGKVSQRWKEALKSMFADHPGRATGGDNPHGHTPTQKKWAAAMAASGHGTMGRVDADGRVHVTASTGDDYVLDRKQLAHATRTGEYPQRDRQNWPEWANAAHKQLQGIGASIEDVLPGSQVKVKAADGTVYTMRRGDLAQSIGAGKIIPPKGHTENAEYDDLAGQFEQKGLGKVDGYLKSLGLYRVVKDGKVHHLRKWDVQKALQTGQLPGDPVIPKKEEAGEAGVRAVLASNPHLGKLAGVLPPDEKGGATRYHLTAGDGTHHYPTAQDLVHLHRHGELPDSHGFEEAGLGKVRERHTDGGLVVEGADGNTRLMTAREVNAAVKAGRLPKQVVATPDAGRPTASQEAERFILQQANRMGVDQVAAVKHHQWLLRAMPEYVKRYGDTQDTWQRMVRAAGDMNRGIGSFDDRYSAALGRAFADHPANTGGMPGKEKDVREALARRGLGKLVRVTDDGKHLVTAPDGRARLLTLAEVHDALQSGKHKPARTLGQPASDLADDIPTVQPIPRSPSLPPDDYQHPQAANTTTPAAGSPPVAARAEQDGGQDGDGEGEQPRGLLGRLENAVDRDILPPGVQGVLDRAGNAVGRVAGAVDGWFDRTFGGKGKADAAPPPPLHPQVQAKVDKVGQKLAATYQQNPAAMAALSRNAGWARAMAKTHAHKVAHRFGGDMNQAEAKLYALIRHLAHAAHTRGVGGVGRGKLGGVGLKVRRLKGLGFDPSSFADGRDPFAALAALFA